MTQPVVWGEVSIVDAERRLLANSLLDFSNERFVLLSESCVPLFNFTFFYDYIINSDKSFISAFDDPSPYGRGRYQILNQTSEYPTFSIMNRFFIDMLRLFLNYIIQQ